MENQHINESILSEEILEDQKKNRIDHMKYMPGMEDIGSEILDQVVDAMHAYDNGMRQRTTDDPMRREQERTTVVPENQKMSTPVGDGRPWDGEDVQTEPEMEPSELPPAGTDRKMPETRADSASVETASCPCEEERIRAMTVDALLEEWDLSYAAFASCLELLKKM